MSSQLTLGTWAPDFDPALGQWHTPAPLCHRMVEWAGITAGQRVLEPSVGGGSIARALLAAGAIVKGFEIDPAWVRCMKQDRAFDAVEIEIADFLQIEPKPDTFDLACMNPPLDGGVGPEHIWRALQWAPRAVSLLRTGDLVGSGHYETLWSRAHLAGIAFLVKRPVFGGDGAKTDFVVVDVLRESFGAAPRIEWWS